MARIRFLENVIQEMRGEVPNQKEENAQDKKKKFGRLVDNRNRYIGNDFWSSISDELGSTKLDPSTEMSTTTYYDTSSDDDYSPSSAWSQPSSESFLFNHHNLLDRNMNSKPLPSQIPFLLEVFSSNVNVVCQVVHLPSISRLVRRNGGDELSSANEALMYSIYYAAIVSMEEDEVCIHFHSYFHFQFQLTKLTVV